jgi:hypothetical protein
MCHLHQDLISGPSSPLRVAIPANNSNKNNNNARNNNDDDNNVLCWLCRMKWGRRIGNYDGENEVEEKERGRR